MNYWQSNQWLTAAQNLHFDVLGGRMTIDRNTIEGVIILAYKLERFELVEELLSLLEEIDF